jgi:hypothetical protein
LGGRFVSGLVVLSAGRVRVVRAWVWLAGCGWLLSCGADIISISRSQAEQTAAGWRPDTGRAMRPGCPGSCRRTRRDAAYFENLASLYRLLIVLEDRLRGERSGLPHHFIDAGEDGLAREEISGAHAQDTVVITGQERTARLALARQMGADDLVPLGAGVLPADHSARSGQAGRQLRVTAARAGLPPRLR